MSKHVREILTEMEELRKSGKPGADLSDDALVKLLLLAQLRRIGNILDQIRLDGISVSQTEI